MKRYKCKDECTAEEALALLEDSSDDVFDNTVSDNVCAERIDVQGIRRLDYSYFAEQFDRGCYMCGTPLILKDVVKPQLFFHF